jgi:valyl-tRNA synthetase
VPCGTVEVLSDKGLDFAAAERRGAAVREKLGVEIARVQAKLANVSFVQRAPAEVVEGERAKLARLQTELEAV